jgi:hypothetical protein
VLALQPRHHRQLRAELGLQLLPAGGG